VCLDGKNQCTKMCTDNWLEMGAPVGSHPDCRGVGEGREDIYDMAGSAAEWLDLCDTEVPSDPALTECYLGGGHLYLQAQFNRCNWIDTAPRGLDSQFAGIRCCADPR
jgi:formylglycine-generating enzyme required for sulfatase activity